MRVEFLFENILERVDDTNYSRKIWLVEIRNWLRKQISPYRENVKLSLREYKEINDAINSLEKKINTTTNSDEVKKSVVETAKIFKNVLENNTTYKINLLADLVTETNFPIEKANEWFKDKASKVSEEEFAELFEQFWSDVGKGAFGGAALGTLGGIGGMIPGAALGAGIGAAKNLFWPRKDSPAPTPSAQPTRGRMRPSREAERDEDTRTRVIRLLRQLQAISPELEGKPRNFDRYLTTLLARLTQPATERPAPRPAPPTPAAPTSAPPSPSAPPAAPRATPTPPAVPRPPLVEEPPEEEPPEPGLPGGEELPIEEPEEELPPPEERLPGEGPREEELFGLESEIPTRSKIELKDLKDRQKEYLKVGVFAADPNIALQGKGGIPPGTKFSSDEEDLERIRQFLLSNPHDQIIDSFIPDWKEASEWAKREAQEASKNAPKGKFKAYNSVIFDLINLGRDFQNKINQAKSMAGNVVLPSNIADIFQDIEEEPSEEEPAGGPLPESEIEQLRDLAVSEEDADGSSFRQHLMKNYPEFFDASDLDNAEEEQWANPGYREGLVDELKDFLAQRENVVQKYKRLLREVNRPKLLKYKTAKMTTGERIKAYVESLKS